MHSRAQKTETTQGINNTISPEAPTLPVCNAD